VGVTVYDCIKKSLKKNLKDIFNKNILIITYIKKRGKEMPKKNYYDYEDIMKATGKSYSAVKKWRISIERLSGYEFKKVKIHVTRKHVKDHYQFTEEEFEKFIKLSKRIDEIKNMTKAVTDIWGDLKSAEERALKKDVADLKKFKEEQKESDRNTNFQIISLKNDIKRLQKLEERLKALEEKQGKGFFSKLKK
jgi:hypothetical protein